MLIARVPNPNMSTVISTPEVYYWHEVCGKGQATTPNFTGANSIPKF